MSDTPTEQPTDITLTGKPAQHIRKLAQRAKDRNASAAGVLMFAAGRMIKAAAILRRADEDNLHFTQQDLSLALAFAKRMKRKANELSQQRASGVEAALHLLDAALQSLESASRGGHKIASQRRRAEVDARALNRLIRSVRERATESAAVLAELEQVIDPMPDLHIIPARQRKQNAKARKSPIPGTIPEPATQVTLDGFDYLGERQKTHEPS